MAGHVMANYDHAKTSAFVAQVPPAPPKGRDKVLTGRDKLLTQGT